MFMFILFVSILKVGTGFIFYIRIFGSFRLLLVEDFGIGNIFRFYFYRVIKFVIIFFIR